jgi:hypothetical protein
MRGSSERKRERERERERAYYLIVSGEVSSAAIVGRRWMHKRGHGEGGGGEGGRGGGVEEGSIPT